MRKSNEQGLQGETENTLFIRCIHDMRDGGVLLRCGLRLVVNVYFKLWGNHCKF